MPHSKLVSTPATLQSPLLPTDLAPRDVGARVDSVWSSVYLQTQGILPCLCGCSNSTLINRERLYVRTFYWLPYFFPPYPPRKICHTADPPTAPISRHVTTASSLIFIFPQEINVNGFLKEMKFRRNQNDIIWGWGKAHKSN